MATNDKRKFDQAREDQQVDTTKDQRFWEAEAVRERETLIAASGSDRNEPSNDDLQRESSTQSGGPRDPMRVTAQGKQSTNSKSRTAQPMPKRSNPMTSDSRGAAEKRADNDQAQGISNRSRAEGDQRQSKVVSIRNDAKAGGRRTGSKKDRAS